MAARARGLGLGRPADPGLSARGYAGPAHPVWLVKTGPEYNEDFLDLLNELTAARVRFVVVGAHAMAVHGAPRATGDLDVFVESTTTNAQRVLEALNRFGAPVHAHGVTADDLARPGMVYQVGLPPRRIDLLTSISGCSFDEAWAGRLTVDLAGQEVPVLGLRELRINKKATGRLKDIADLELLGES